MSEHQHVVVGLAFTSTGSTDRLGAKLDQIKERQQAVRAHRDAPDAGVGAVSTATSDLADALSSGSSNAKVHAALANLRTVAKNHGDHLVHRRAGDKSSGPTAHLQGELDKAQADLQKAQDALGRIAAAGQSAADHGSGVVHAGSGSQVANNVGGLFGDLSSAIDALGDLIGGPAGAALNALAALIGSIGDVITSVFGDASSAGNQTTDPPPDQTAPDPGDPGDLGDPGGPGGCFTGSTTVLMADGSHRPIEDLAVGDVVLGRDEITGADGAGRIERVLVHHVGRTLTLRLRDGHDVETTSVHRFAAAGGDFVDASSLRPGAELLTHDGQIAVLDEAVDVSEPATVYNLTVGRLHTYFVGESDLWVHNAKTREVEPDDPPDSGDEDPD